LSYLVKAKETAQKIFSAQRRKKERKSELLTRLTTIVKITKNTECIRQWKGKTQLRLL